jgi:hypothetical protein
MSKTSWDYARLVGAIRELSGIDTNKVAKQLEAAMLDPKTGLEARAKRIAADKHQGHPGTRIAVQNSIHCYVTPTRREVRLISTHPAQAFWELGFNPKDGSQYITPTKKKVLAIPVAEFNMRNGVNPTDYSGQLKDLADKSKYVHRLLFAKYHEIQTVRRNRRTALSAATRIADRKRLMEMQSFQFRGSSNRKAMVLQQKDFGISDNQARVTGYNKEIQSLMKEYRELLDEWNQTRRDHNRLARKVFKVSPVVRGGKLVPVIFAKRVRIPRGYAVLGPAIDEFNADPANIELIENSKYLKQFATVRAKIKIGRRKWQTH